MAKVFLLIFIFLSVFLRRAAADSVRITTGEWAPYTSHTLPNDGLLSEIARAAFADQGITMTLAFFPWGRADQLSKSGEWDGTIAYAKNRDREKYFLFSDPLYVGKYVLFHLKKHPLEWNTLADLKDVPMASTIAFGGMGQEFLDAEKAGQLKVERLPSDVQSFNMLFNDRVRAVPSDLEVGLFLIKKNFPNEMNRVTYSSHPIKNSEYRLVISKKNPHAAKLIESFNKGLKNLKTSGRYKKILNKWKTGSPRDNTSIARLKIES